MTPGEYPGAYPAIVMTSCLCSSLPCNSSSLLPISRQSSRTAAALGAYIPSQLPVSAASLSSPLLPHLHLLPQHSHFVFFSISSYLLLTVEIFSNALNSEWKKIKCVMWGPAQDQRARLRSSRSKGLKRGPCRGRGSRPGCWLRSAASILSV